MIIFVIIKLIFNYILVRLIFGIMRLENMNNIKNVWGLGKSYCLPSALFITGVSILIRSYS